MSEAKDEYLFAGINLHGENVMGRSTGGHFCNILVEGWTKHITDKEGMTEKETERPIEKTV